MKLDLRIERLNRGKSVVEMAEAIGVPDHVYRRVEKTGAMPNEANALKIASYFGLSVAAMWQLEPSSGAAA